MLAFCGDPSLNNHHGSGTSYSCTVPYKWHFKILDKIGQSQGLQLLGLQLKEKVNKVVAQNCELWNTVLSRSDDYVNALDLKEAIDQKDLYENYFTELTIGDNKFKIFVSTIDGEAYAGTTKKIVLAECTNNKSLNIYSVGHGMQISAVTPEWHTEILKNIDGSIRLRTRRPFGEYDAWKYDYWHAALSNSDDYVKALDLDEKNICKGSTVNFEIEGQQFTISAIVTRGTPFGCKEERKVLVVFCTDVRALMPCPIMDLGPLINCQIKVGTFVSVVKYEWHRKILAYLKNNPDITPNVFQKQG